MLNPREVFENRYTIWLQSVDFKTLKQDKAGIEVSCYDQNKVTINNDTIDIELTRKVSSDVFVLEITMGAKLKFRSNCEKRPLADEIEDEIIKTPIVTNLLSRISMLIGQVTSAHGREPLITPPTFLKENDVLEP
ncbi:MAG: hypothetical protein U0M04_04810 [Christensenellales bacterium]|nr:hypothetical protein [Christensenellales bacterium]